MADDTVTGDWMPVSGEFTVVERRLWGTDGHLYKFNEWTDREGHVHRSAPEPIEATDG